MEIDGLVSILAIVFFAGLLGGYIWGRKDGKQEGFSLGFAYAPLELRRHMLIKGHCLFCGQSLPEEKSGQDSSVN